jgi:hypothetical protein
METPDATSLGAVPTLGDSQVSQVGGVLHTPCISPQSKTSRVHHRRVSGRVWQADEGAIIGDYEPVSCVNVAAGLPSPDVRHPSDR